MEGRALGKGISALIPEKSKDGKTVAVTYLKTSDIRENSFQPRTNYDDTKLAELVSSIKEKGVLQPILVRKKNDGHEVIAGDRRLRAARVLKMGEVPVVVKDVTDEEALVIALVENIQREELNPIEEANAFKRLINEFQFTQDSVAQSVGKDRSTISNILRLLKLPTEIQKHLSEGALSMGHARALLSVSDDNVQKEFSEYTIKKSLSVRELENLIKHGLKAVSRRETAKPASRNEQIAMLEEELQKLLGTKVRIVAQKKRGRIVIDFYSLEDLKRILQAFKK